MLKIWEENNIVSEIYHFADMNSHISVQNKLQIQLSRKDVFTLHIFVAFICIKQDFLKKVVFDCNLIIRHFIWSFAGGDHRVEISLPAAFHDLNDPIDNDDNNQSQFTSPSHTARSDQSEMALQKQQSGVEIMIGLEDESGEVRPVEIDEIDEADDEPVEG